MEPQPPPFIPERKASAPTSRSVEHSAVYSLFSAFRDLLCCGYGDRYYEIDDTVHREDSKEKDSARFSVSSKERLLSWRPDGTPSLGAIHPAVVSESQIAAIMSVVEHPYTSSTKTKTADTRAIKVSSAPKRTTSTLNRHVPNPQVQKLKPSAKAASKALEAKAAAANAQLIDISVPTEPRAATRSNDAVEPSIAAEPAPAPAPAPAQPRAKDQSLAQELTQALSKDQPPAKEPAKSPFSGVDLTIQNLPARIVVPPPPPMPTIRESPKEVDNPFEETVEASPKTVIPADSIVMTDIPGTSQPFQPLVDVSYSRSILLPNDAPEDYKPNKQVPVVKRPAVKNAEASVDAKPTKPTSAARPFGGSLVPTVPVLPGDEPKEPEVSNADDDDFSYPSAANFDSYPADSPSSGPTKFASMPRSSSRLPPKLDKPLRPQSVSSLADIKNSSVKRGSTSTIDSIYGKMNLKLKLITSNRTQLVMVSTSMDLPGVISRIRTKIQTDLTSTISLKYRVDDQFVPINSDEDLRKAFAASGIEYGAEEVDATARLTLWCD
ncbi:uncharacterized protein BJ171DRAFT_63306 [Polychytrium aggregatum]|uniref:uncharacterized protein n=1 Tax=Polychytrium aggregatum TaxID=110093 RepID=UPI0022FEA054|nr:uncharacterized protein BJ171DRAFT_63306 [Polychytrium aggregatum]KAI9205601.1 hypothetical protein BJ171DRAFT_63306 [Polychytrium aggregatum]